MSERKFYLTSLSVNILSEDEPYTFDGFRQLDYDLNDGDFVGGLNGVPAVIQMTPKECANELLAIGSTPEFFNLDNAGNDIEL